MASPQNPENNKTICLQIILIFLFSSPWRALSLSLTLLLKVVQRGIEDDGAKIENNRKKKKRER
jgi:hypothetical protein